MNEFGRLLEQNICGCDVCFCADADRDDPLTPVTRSRVAAHADGPERRYGGGDQREQPWEREIYRKQIAIALDA